MSAVSTRSLEDLVRDCGMEILIDWHAPPERAVPFLAGVLAQAGEECSRRFGSEAFRFSEPELNEEYSRNPQHVTALFQAIALTQNPTMLVMAWRAINGAAVESLDVSFARAAEFRMRVVLEGPEDSAGADGSTFESNDIRDLRLIRHFATMAVNDRPYVSGFYPLRLERD